MTEKLLDIANISHCGFSCSAVYHNITDERQKEWKQLLLFNSTMYAHKSQLSFFKPNLGCHWLHLLLQTTTERAGRPRGFRHKLAPGEQYQWLPTPSHPLRSLLPVCTTRVGPALSSPSQWSPLSWTQVVSPSGHWWRCRVTVLISFLKNDKTSKQFIYIYILVFFFYCLYFLGSNIHSLPLAKILSFFFFFNCWA